MMQELIKGWSPLNIEWGTKRFIDVDYRVTKDLDSGVTSLEVRGGAQGNFQLDDKMAWDEYEQAATIFVTGLMRSDSV